MGERRLAAALVCDARATRLGCRRVLKRMLDCKQAMPSSEAIEGRNLRFATRECWPRGCVAIACGVSGK